jgi:hypothetical protein
MQLKNVKTNNQYLLKINKANSIETTNEKWKKKKTRDQKLTGQVCEKNKASLGLEPKPRPVFFPKSDQCVVRGI